MFERFTDRARRVVVHAQEEARLLNHNYIGTEHVLLGLLHEGEGLAGRTLRELGMSLEGARVRVEEMIGRGVDKPQGHIPFTPRSKKSMELSLREALKQGHNYIGTEHLLLGLLTEGEGVAVQVMILAGLTTSGVREKTLELMKGFAAMAAGAETVPAVRTQGGTERLEPAPAGPLCPRCRASLESSAAYKTVEVAEAVGGTGKAHVLFVYCRTCGHTFDTLVAPED